MSIISSSQSRPAACLPWWLLNYFLLLAPCTYLALILQLATIGSTQFALSSTWRHILCKGTSFSPNNIRSFICFIALIWARFNFFQAFLCYWLRCRQSSLSSSDNTVRSVLAPLVAAYNLASTTVQTYSASTATESSASTAKASSESTSEPDSFSQSSDFFVMGLVSFWLQVLLFLIHHFYMFDVIVLFGSC